MISFYFDNYFTLRLGTLTRSLQRVLVHISKCRLDSSLERCLIGMSRLVGHSFNDVPYVVIHQIQSGFQRTQKQVTASNSVHPGNLGEHLSNFYHIEFEAYILFSNSTHCSFPHTQGFC